MPHGMNTGTDKRSTYTPLSIPNLFGTYPTKAQNAGKRTEARPEPAANTGSRYKYTPLEINTGIKSQPTKAQSAGRRSRGEVYTPASTVEPSAFLKVESKTKTAVPTQNPERPGQPTGGVETPALGGENYSVMGVEYDYNTGQAINPGTGKTSSGGYSIDPKTSARTDYSRGDTRTNANGVVQTGTNTSPMAMSFDDVNSILAGHGINKYGFGEKYSSNQLPSTKSSPDGAYSSEDAAAFGRSAKDNSVIAAGGSTETVIDGDTDLDNVKTDYLGGNRKTRGRAFLDYDGPGGSMAALRAAEASDGVFYAGGKHHIANPNAGQEGQNDFMSISKEDNYNIASGNQTAQGLRDSYVSALTSKEDTPAPLPDSEQQASNVETSPNQKPFTVAPSDIPSNLSGAAGEEYLKRLDAGEFTRMR